MNMNNNKQTADLLSFINFLQRLDLLCDSKTKTDPSAGSTVLNMSPPPACFGAPGLVFEVFVFRNNFLIL